MDIISHAPVSLAPLYNPQKRKQSILLAAFLPAKTWCPHAVQTSPTYLPHSSTPRITLLGPLYIFKKGSATPPTILLLLLPTYIYRVFSPPSPCNIPE